MMLKPNGGEICIQSGGAAAANHNERMSGIRDTIAGRADGGKYPSAALKGENGWTEASGCPLYTNDDLRSELMIKKFNTDGFLTHQYQFGTNTPLNDSSLEEAHIQSGYAVEYEELKPISAKPVSYTHLTLPTICSV